MRNEQDPGLAHQQRGGGSLHEILEVRLGQVVLDQPDGDGRPVAAEVDEAGALELVQRPDHARGAQVERRHGRQRPVVQVAGMGGPELRLVERALGLGDDRDDRSPHAVLVPGTLGQRLVAGGS